MDCVFGSLDDGDGNTGIVVFVERLSKVVHLADITNSIDGKGSAMLYIERVQHCLLDASTTYIVCTTAKVRLHTGSATCDLQISTDESRPAILSPVIRDPMIHVR